MSEPLKPLLEELRRQLLTGLASIDRDVEHRMLVLAAETSAAYATRHMLTAPPFRARKHAGNGHFELLEHALTLAQADGFYAEFGVFQGASLTFLANLSDRVVYGFDSFEGLPEPWSAAIRQGTFGLGGNAPELGGVQFRNFRLVKGRFGDSLPEFTAQIAGPARLLHLDCYLRSSTADVLDGLADRIGPGTVIVLRQYFNFPGWEDGQFRAFQDFCARDGRRYRYVGYTATGTSAAVVME